MSNFADGLLVEVWRNYWVCFCDVVFFTWFIAVYDLWMCAFGPWISEYKEMIAAGARDFWSLRQLTHVHTSISIDQSTVDSSEFCDLRVFCLSIVLSIKPVGHRTTVFKPLRFNDLSFFDRLFFSDGLQYASVTGHHCASMINEQSNDSLPHNSRETTAVFELVLARHRARRTCCC